MNVPPSKPKSTPPRGPIVLRRIDHGAEAPASSAHHEPPPKNENPLRTIPLPKINLNNFAPPSEALDENKRLKEEVAEYRKSLEQWAQAEADWSEQRKLFKVMAESVTDIIVLLDTQGNRTWSNPAYSHLLGYEPQELIGTFALSEVHPDDKDHAIEVLQTAIEQGITQQAEFRVQQRDGRWAHLLTETVPVTGADGVVSAAVLMGHDVTEKKNLEEALALASTQVTAAGMVEGMARDFDQILTNVAGNLAIAQNLNGPTNAIAMRLNEIDRALQRARDIIEQMFSLSSHADQTKVRVALDPILHDAVNTVLKGTMVRAEYMIPSKLPEIEIDVETFSHAIRNVVTNCIQAMDKGVIRVTADFISQEQFKSNLEIPLKPGNYIRIRLQDQGHGIPEKILPRVFEPYFTTRQGSQGLGLTTALSAMQRLGGTITLESTLGAGTTAFIYLPAVLSGPLQPASVSPNPMAAAMQTSANKSGRISGMISKIAPAGPAEKKRILLMDDEQMILDIVSRMLSHLGYEVKTCTDGSQAIAAFAKAKSSTQKFDVVLMDLIIPNGVGGQDAVHTLKKIDPQAKVIASSGHLDHPVMLDCRKFGFSAVLEKPYKLEKLQQVIDSVINSPV